MRNTKSVQNSPSVYVSEHFSLSIVKMNTILKWRENNFVKLDE